jgi:hypothetical protein
MHAAQRPSGCVKGSDRVERRKQSLGALAKAGGVWQEPFRFALQG